MSRAESGAALAPGAFPEARREAPGLPAASKAGAVSRLALPAAVFSPGEAAPSPAAAGIPCLLPGWPASRPPPRAVAVMQPYFFPYPGYFALICHVDVFILDDLARYSAKSWMNRNRIQKPGQGWQYLTLPVQKHPSDTPICRIRIAAQPWQAAFWGRLSVYAHAPGYRAVKALLQPLLAAPGAELAGFNEASLRAVCRYLGIGTPVYRLSRLALPGYRPPYPKGENALGVCRALGGIREYRNPPGGAAFYPRAPYARAGIRLRFERWQEPRSSDGTPCPSGLSILDALMRLPPEAIRKHLDNVQLFE